MTIMQMIRKSVYDDGHTYAAVYKCLDCHHKTCEPHKFCNNCGSEVTEKRAFIKKTRRRSRRVRRVLGSRLRRKFDGSTNFYAVSSDPWFQFCSAQEDKNKPVVIRRFDRREGMRTSVAHSLYDWLKHARKKGIQDVHDIKVVRITAEERKNFSFPRRFLDYKILDDR